MSFVFKDKDVIHNIAVKFSRAFLPEARKPYYLRTAHEPELDIRSVASKANIYKIKTDPDVIVEGFNAAMELMYYLAADGYKIKTPLFSLRLKIPGEYDGTETRLPEGVFPVVRLQPSADFREYVKDTVKVVVDGKAEESSSIAEVIDEASGLADDTVTIGRILTIRGNGLKIDADPANRNLAGLFFVPEKGTPVKAQDIPVNEPLTLKAVVPGSLTAGKEYTLLIVTQGSASGSHLLAKLREIRSDFTVTAQKDGKTAASG